MLFLGKGRLGNQLFQWTVLQKYFPRSTVWSPSLAALTAVIETGDRLRTTLAPAWLDRISRRKLGRTVMRLLFRHFRLGGYAHEPIAWLPNGCEAPSGELSIRGGDRRLVFVDGGYYQNFRTTLRPADFQTLRLRPQLKARAEAAIGAATQGGIRPSAVLHVRRTDYLHFRPYGLPDVTLPAAYYVRAASRLRTRLGAQAVLLIVTDDAGWCQTELAALQPFHIMSGNEEVDFAALTLFPSIVVSNSSFSLAAACLSRDAREVIAPEYWFGARIGQWFPPQLRSADPRFVYL